MLGKLYYQLMATIGFLIRRSFRPNATNKIVRNTMASTIASGTLFMAIDTVARPQAQATLMTHRTVSLVLSSNFSSINDWLLPNQLMCKGKAGVERGAKRPPIQLSASQVAGDA
jgi:hypothetical protein